MASRTPFPGLRSVVGLSPNRRTEAQSTNSSPTPRRPLGAAEPSFDHGTSSSFLEPKNYPEHSLSHHETHVIEPLLEDARLSSSPTPMTPQLGFCQYQDCPDPSKTTVLLHLIRKTGWWVGGGVVVMLLGIILLQTLVLPRIHSCPVSASCPGSFDPNTGNSLQLLQTFISYWLKVGIVISSTGILKLSAYQAWFILMHRGNTVKNLDLNLGAIRGSVNDAAYLLFQKSNRLLSLFVFALLGIGAAMSLVVGLSIEKDTSIMYLPFTYNGTSMMPDSSLAQINNDGQLQGIQKVITWALKGDKSHGGAFRGTLVVPDARTSQASNALPGGPTINGWFTCEGWSNYTMPPGRAEWHIWFNNTRYIATNDMSLATALWKIDTAVAAYVWVSNTTGLIPNATRTEDGGMNIALCTHFLSMDPQKSTKSGVDYLEATDPWTSGCHSKDTNTCVADSVNNAILNWWGGVGTALWHISCRGGVLGPMPSSTDERYCPLTQELWKETAIAMLDGIVQTAPTNTPVTQDLHARVVSLSTSRWWLNATIPAATVVVYLIGLAYTCMLSKGNRILKELSLGEVVEAAQTHHVHDLVVTGKLKITRIRYDSRYGFVDSES